MTFYITFPSIDLDVSGVWPDGDAPENPTAEDVARVMRDAGGFYTVVRDWNLLKSLYVNDIEVR